jgi:hypothetical protein
MKVFKYETFINIYNPMLYYNKDQGWSYHQPNSQWLILILFGQDVLSLAIENGLEGNIWLNQIDEAKVAPFLKDDLYLALVGF